MKSKIFGINLKDIVKALVLAFLTAFLTGLYQLIQTGGVISWQTMQPILFTSVAAVLAYILKNFLTNSEDKFLKKE